MTILREQAVFGLSQWPRLFLFQLLNHHKNVPECHRGTLVIKAVSVHYLLLWSSRLICFTCLVSCQCPRETPEGILWDVWFTALLMDSPNTQLLGHNLSSVATNFSDLLLPVIKLVCSGQCLVIQCLHWIAMALALRAYIGCPHILQCVTLYIHTCIQKIGVRGEQLVSEIVSRDVPCNWQRGICNT